jgi:betaine-homocysteine S-methyltransferase
MHQADVTRENWSVGDACKRLADAGADVVGLNCIRGPATMMPLLKEIRRSVKTHMAALPVPFARTTINRRSSRCATRTGITTKGAGRFPSRSILSRATVSSSRNSGATHGARHPLSRCLLRRGSPSHPRAGRSRGQAPAASKYSPDMSKHAFLGSHERIKQVQKDYANKL